MVERLRSVRVVIEVDTNKQTVREVFYSTEDAIRALERLRDGEMIEGIHG